MTLSYVMIQNLRRNPLRVALTGIAFALPMGIFVVAISFVMAMKSAATSIEKELRIGVHQKTSLINSLPEGHRRKIESLDPDRNELVAVCGMRWFGGRVPETQNTLTSLAADPDTFPIVYSDTEMTPEEVETWNRERTACIVGRVPADAHGWKVGQRIELESTVPPYLTLEFKVVKIVENKERANFFWFRRDYLVEANKAKKVDDPRCNIFWVKCKNAESLKHLQVKIDELFANSPDATKSEDENTFGANFTQAAGNIPGLMSAMSIVVVVVVSLVAGNTMMMSFRERMRELAVFKAIGFQPGRIFKLVLGESILMAMMGALAGVVPVTTFLLVHPIRGLRMGPVSVIEISWPAAGVSIGIALLVGIAAGLWPALQALRLKTTDALRRVA